jgi:hypothetical protein
MLAYAVSARALLALALFGAFILGLIAMFRGDLMSLVIMGIYSTVTIGPVTILEIRKRS